MIGYYQFAAASLQFFQSSDFIIEHTQEVHHVHEKSEGLVDQPLCGALAAVVMAIYQADQRESDQPDQQSTETEEHKAQAGADETAQIIQAVHQTRSHRWCPCAKAVSCFSQKRQKADVSGSEKAVWLLWRLSRKDELPVRPKSKPRANTLSHSSM